MSHGIFVNVQNGHGETPAMVAAQAGDDASDALWFLINSPMFNVLVRDKSKNTLLHHAVQGGSLKNVMLIMDKFPYLKIHDKNVLNITPLELALQKGLV